MIYAAQPSAHAALRAVKEEVAAALRTIDAISEKDELTYEDDFGTRYIDPADLAQEGLSSASLGMLAAAEGVALVFGSEDTSAFTIGDLDWAANNLRTIAAELKDVGEGRLELPHDDRTEHIRAAVLQEVSRLPNIEILPVESPGAVQLRGSDSLDAQQRAAVDASAGVDLIVNAGAGSGKTHMLSLRIARLVAGRSISAERAIALTFSRAAREQIQDRLNSLAVAGYPALTRVDVRTIHSLGRRILQLASNAGKTRVRPGFEVVIDGRRRLPNGKAVTAPLPFIEEYEGIFDGVHDDRSEKARLILYPNAINALRMGHPQLGIVPTSEELAGGKVTVLDPRSGSLAQLDSETLRTVWRRYERLLENRNAIDFPGMVSDALQAVRAHPALARMAAAPYQHIFVDEYQDTSTAQAELLFELAAQGALLSCVGDGDQAIFTFAGADPKGITEFVPRLKARTGREASVLRLETNYRSVAPIVASADSVIARNRSRLSKSMVAARSESPTAPITATRAPFRYAAPWVALRVRELLDSGADPADVAVLFRKEAGNSPQESTVIQHLEKLSVPVTTDPHDPDGVRVLSIHQAKGSEFRHVFCLYLGPGHFPDDRGDDEEERRLLYVAITRAKDTLVACGVPGADPDLFGEFSQSESNIATVSVESLSEVLAVETVDQATMGLTDMRDLDISMLDWDEATPET